MKILRFILALLSGFMILWFAATFFRHILNLGNIAGIVICGFIFFHSVFSGQFKKLKNKFLSKGFTKFIWRFCQTCIAVFAVYALLCTSIMVYFSCIEPDTNSTVITLGALVHKSHKPSSSLRGRINATYDFLNDNADSKAVLSGGQGDDENISEAQCMYELLTEKGIDKERLIIEDKSSNTEENIRNSYREIKKYNLPKNIAIATDSYHQLRARIIARKQGIEGKIGAVNADTTIFIVPTYYVREWFALPAELLL